MAVRASNLELSKALIETGANVNAMSYVCAINSFIRIAKSKRLQCHSTALMAAVELGHVELCKVLVEAGADVNARNIVRLTQ